MTTPYTYDELVGVLNRDESVDLNRLAASVVAVMGTMMDGIPDYDDEVRSAADTEPAKPVARRKAK